MTRILVTGGGGQLGTDVVATARSAGHTVASFSRSGELAGDLTDPTAVAAAVEGFEPELIVHEKSVFVQLSTLADIGQARTVVLQIVLFSSGGRRPAPTPSG